MRSDELKTVLKSFMVATLIAALLFIAAADGEDNEIHARGGPGLDATVAYGGEVWLRLSSNHSDWWFAIDGGDCVETDSRTHGPIHGYGQAYDWTLTARAYSDSACSDSNLIASATLAMPATSLASSVRTGEVEFTLSNWSSDWWFSIDYGECFRVSGKTTSIVPHQTGQFTAGAYRTESDCPYPTSASAQLGESTYDVAIDDMALDLSASVSDGVVDITLSKHDGSAFPDNWWFRIDNGSCASATTSTVGGIRGYHRPYDWTMNIRAHSDSGCAAQVAYAALDMPAVSLSASVSGGAVSLELSHYPPTWNWWFRIDGGGCTQAQGKTVTGIRGYGQPNDWTMNIRAYSNSWCGSQIAHAALAMPATALSALVSNDDKVSLTLSNYALGWWFRIGGGTCTSVSGDTVSGISGYRTGTYSVKAYRHPGHCYADHAKLGETAFTIP